MNEKKRIIQQIAYSFFEDMYDWVSAKDINCYAFARGLIYPDTNHEFYFPGKMYHILSGKKDENYIFPCNNLSLMDIDIQNDSVALGQKCQRISFNDIKENDGNFYFGITEIHSLSDSDDHRYHFICRTPSGMWLHKSDWVQAPQPVNWNVYGKTFTFNAILVDITSDSPKRYSVPTEGICFKDYFYRLELPED